MSKILIVVDMQNDFVNGSLGTKEAQSILPNIINEIKDKINENYSFYATRDTHFDKDINNFIDEKKDYFNTLEGKKLPVKHCIFQTEGWKIVPEIDAILPSNTFMINKLTFGSTELVDVIKKENNTIEEIELIGVCTDICVISNALLLRAAFPNVKITVKENCCAGVTQESHADALKTMQMCQIDIA